MASSDESIRSEQGPDEPQPPPMGSPLRASSTESEPMTYAGTEEGPTSPEYTPSSPRYPPASPEYSPASPDYSPPRPNPPKPTLRPRGPRMKFTARKTTGIFPRGPLAPRHTEPPLSSTFHIGGPSSASGPGGLSHFGAYHSGEFPSLTTHRDMPYGYYPSRAPVDLGGQQRMMERLEQTEAQLTRTVSVTRQLGQEVVRLRKEVKALKNSKGLLAKVWNWFHKGT